MKAKLVMVLVLCCIFSSGCEQSENEKFGGEPLKKMKVSKNNVADLMERIGQLERDAEGLQDVRDIKKLQRAYGYYLSQHMWNETADLFSEDGELEFAQQGNFKGKESVRDFLFSLSGGKEGIKFGSLDEHMLVQPVINLSEDNNAAYGQWRAFIWQGQFENSASWQAGIYENEYIKIDGVWKIKKKHWNPTFSSDYEDGWTKGNVVAW